MVGSIVARSGFRAFARRRICHDGRARSTIRPPAPSPSQPPSGLPTMTHALCILARALPAVALSALLAACAIPAPHPDTLLPGQPQPAGLALQAVAQRMEPRIEAACRQQNIARNCDFVVALDDNPALPPNAFQTILRDGQPAIVFTVALVRAARNPDEIAFVLGHEAAHHIFGHIGQRDGEARAGAAIAGAEARAAGLSRAEVSRAREIGAMLGARRFSKEYELEADALGARLAWQAGYDPLLGAAFFARLPDPGDRIMGSHPSNSERQAMVVAVVRRLEGG